MAEQPAQIAQPVQPFLPPRKLPGPLAQLRQYWNGLRRGENAVPFSDDVNPSALTGLSDNLILVDVFDRPQRFRFRACPQLVDSQASDCVIHGRSA